MSSSALDRRSPITETGKADFGKQMTDLQLLRAARNCDNWYGIDMKVYGLRELVGFDFGKFWRYRNCEFHTSEWKEVK